MKLYFPSQTYFLLTDRRRRSSANYDSHSNAVVDIRYHPTGQMLTTRGQDNVVCLWDIRNMKVGKVTQ